MGARLQHREVWINSFVRWLVERSSDFSQNRSCELLRDLLDASNFYKKKAVFEDLRNFEGYGRDAFTTPCVTS
jgi:hypothetical protein